MKSKPVFVNSIAQKDNHSFVIEWSDGLRKSYRLNELQKLCECAGCVDEGTGKRLIDDQKIDPNVRAVRIVSVGRYALRIHFTRGCSSGIYTFDRLYESGKNEQ